jgi:leucyl/phenylalanyl-tRNA---protein transferase
VLTPALILNGYTRAIFPMAINRQGSIGWFSPDPRAIIPLDERFHIPHGLKRTLRKGEFKICADTDFEAVIKACATTHGSTWISPQIMQNYCALHRLGFAHSIEVRRDLRLAGGLYGVALGGAFFGESMFHDVTDASKVALVALVTRLRERGFILLDTQWTTPHLEQFGTREIPKSEYVQILEKALALPCTF